MTNTLRRLFDVAFQVFNWVLPAMWLTLTFSSPFWAGKEFGNSVDVAFVMFSLLTCTNAAASVLGAAYALLKWRESEKAGLWLTCFFVGAFFMCNVLLVPLFRHYVLGHYRLTNHSSGAPSAPAELQR